MSSRKVPLEVLYKVREDAIREKKITVRVPEGLSQKTFHYAVQRFFVQVGEWADVISVGDDELYIIMENGL
jgi:hypothetical protein